MAQTTTHNPHGPALNGHVQSAEPPCPTWCAMHHDGGFKGWHLSKWHSWRPHPSNDDMDVFEAQAVRHDYDGVPGSDFITEVGQIDFNVRISDAAGVVPRDDKDFDGSLSCASLRRFGQFLLALANEFDPHETDGSPLEWRQRRNERRQP